MKVIIAWKKCLSPKLENNFWYRAKKKIPHVNNGFLMPLHGVTWEVVNETNIKELNKSLKQYNQAIFLNFERCPVHY
jgi:hypothetical protein